MKYKKAERKRDEKIHNMLFEGMNYSEVGRKMKLSYERIRQIAIRDLKVSARDLDREKWTYIMDEFRVCIKEGKDLQPLYDTYGGKKKVSEDIRYRFKTSPEAYFRKIRNRKIMTYLNKGKTIAWVSRRFDMHRRSIEIIRNKNK